MSMAWVDPPPSVEQSRRSVGDDVRDWRGIVDDLKAHPRRWALLDPAATASQLNAIRQRTRRWAGKTGRTSNVQVAQRRNEDGTLSVYARWIGPEQ